MIDRKVWCTALVLVGVLSGGACEQATTNDTKPIFETSFPPPTTPDQPFVLVRAAGPLTRPEAINRIAVSGDYLFFASITDGIYRMPKYGGDLSTVDEDLHGSFTHVEANSTEVFWDHTTYDKNNQRHLSIRRRAVAGGPTVTMLELGGGVLPSLLGNPSLRVDDQAAFLFTTHDSVYPGGSLYADPDHSALSRIPIDGSSATVLMTETPLSYTSWMMDGDYLYFDTSPPLDYTSTLTRMLKTGGTVETIIGQMQSSGISAADDQFLYGFEYSPYDPDHIDHLMGLSKTGADPPVVVAALPQTDTPIFQSTMIDGKTFYFATQFGLWRVDAPGGVPQHIGPRFHAQIYQVVDDGQNFFVLYNNDTVALVSKTAAASAP